MDQMISPKQLAELRTALEKLKRTIDKRNKLMAMNNALAAKNPAFSAKLRVERADPVDRQSAVALKKVQTLLVKNGMGGLGSVQLTAIIITASVAAAIILASIASMMYTNYQVQREERALATQAPFIAFTQQASTAVWAVLGLGAVGLGGLIYWDYRSNQTGRSVRRGTSRDVLYPEYRRSSGSRSLSNFGGTTVDEDIADRMEEVRSVEDAVERDKSMSRSRQAPSYDIRQRREEYNAPMYARGR